MIDKEVIGMLISGAVSLVLGIIGIRQKGKIKELQSSDTKEKIKRTVSDGISDFSNFNMIKQCVDMLFADTKADRFLILIAINGKNDPKHVSVIFEQHKDSIHSVNAITRYKNISIDSSYKKLLTQTELEKRVFLDVSKMDKCLLKDLYNFEGVKYSQINFMFRSLVDKENDILVYSSIATMDDKAFTTQELTLIRLAYDSTIRPTVRSVMETF